MSTYDKCCDWCRRPILHVDHLVSATTYGVVAHRDCWESLTPAEVLRLLYLDDIRQGPATAYDWDMGFFPNGAGELAWAKKK